MKSRMKNLAWIVFTKQGGNEILQCLDALSGKQNWQSTGYLSEAITGPAASYPGPRSSVAFSDGKVVTLGAWGDVACFEASDGNLLWKNEDYKNQVPRFIRREIHSLQPGSGQIPISAQVTTPRS